MKMNSNILKFSKKKKNCNVMQGHFVRCDDKHKNEKRKASGIAETPIQIYSYKVTL